MHGSTKSHFWLSACLALTLSACATTTADRHGADTKIPPANDASAVAAVAQDTEPASGSDAEDDLPDLPNVELTAELLEQLLLLSFAPYAGDSLTSAQQAFAAAQTSQDYRLASYAAVSALRAKEYQLAISAAQLWLQLVPQQDNAKTTLVFAYLGAGDAPAAYSTLLQRDQALPLTEQVENAASLLVRQGNAKAALEVVELFAAEHADSADVLLSAAYVADRFLQPEQAATWLNRALELRPDWDKAAQLQASVLQRQGKTEERAQFIEQFLQRNPKSVSMRINHAAELAREEKYREALVLMQAVLEDDDENVPALSYAAALAEYIEEDDLAKQWHQRVVRLEPDNDEAYWALARFAVREENYQRAEDYYQEISGEQLYFRAQLQVANMRYHTRGLREAINALRVVEPRTEQEYIDRATTRHYLLMQEHLYEEAFAAINETLIYLPENVELRYARALVAAEIRELPTAEEDLRFVIDQQPENADALNALGYTLADQTERFVEARDLIARALEISPEDAHILDSMGWVLYRLGELGEAENYLRQAFEKSPQAEVAAHLGEVLWEQGRHQEAREIWTLGIDDDKDNPVLTATLQRYGFDSAETLARGLAPS